MIGHCRLVPVLLLLFAGVASADDRILHTNIEHTDVNLFLPDGVKVLRGVLIDPANQRVAAGHVWSEACHHWGFARMGVMLENVDKRNNRVKTLHRVIDSALDEFAEKSSHPELKNVPFLFGGMSKGGGWSAELGQDYGRRTIAFNNVCGWVGNPKKDLSMPAVVIIGGIPDGFKMLDAIPKQFEPARAKGAPWCLAVQWGNAHNYGNADALAFPFLDAVVAARIRADADARSGPVALRDIDLKSGWLGDRSTCEGHFATIAPYDQYKDDRSRATWLPNRYVAFAWRSFVSHDPRVQLNAATADGKQKSPPFSPTARRGLVLHGDHELTLSADVTAAETIRFVRFFDGDVLLGEVSRAPFTVTWKNIPAGPRCVFVEYTTAADTVGVSNPVLVLRSEVPNPPIP